MATSPVRVIQLLGSKKAGGAEMFYLRLITALHKPEWKKQIVILPVVRKGSWMAAELQARGIAFRTLPFMGWWDVFSKIGFLHLAATWHTDAVMAWMNRAATVLPKFKAVPWAQTARIGGYYDLKYYRGKVSGLVVNTDDLAVYACGAGWPNDALTMLPNFVPEPPAGWRDGRAAARKALGISAKATVLMAAGRLHTVKGLDVALGVLTKLPDDVVLLLVGEGPEKAVLQRLADELGVADRVRWAGWRADLPAVACAADVWLVPSRHEPLGNVVLDAWVHGIPLVSARAKGPAALIADGVDGLLVDVEDADGMARAVERVLSEKGLAARLVKAGRTKIAGQFSEDVVVGRFVTYYKEQIAGRKKR